MTNFHDLLSLMCPDFQLRVVKSAFKAAWVVLKGMALQTSSQIWQDTRSYLPCTSLPISNRVKDLTPSCKDGHHSH